MNICEYEKVSKVFVGEEIKSYGGSRGAFTYYHGMAFKAQIGSGPGA